MLSRPDAAKAAGALLGTAVLAFLATGLHPVWWLTWLAPVPVLWYAYRASARPAALVAGAAWFLGSLNMVAYYRGAWDVPVAVIAVVSLVQALAFALTVSLSRSLVSRGARWSGLLAFPSAWVAFEFLLSRVSPHGTLWNLAYTQMDFGLLLQLASVTGLAGISFVLFLVPAAVALSIDGRSARPLALAAIVVSVALDGGVWRLSGRRHPDTIVRVGLASWDRRPLFPDDSSDVRAIVEGYVSAVDSLAARGAAVIVLPELIALHTRDDPARLSRSFADAARRNRVTLVVGVSEAGSTEERDAALVYAPYGALVATYAKHHLVPGLESHFRRGTELVVLGRARAGWGVQICKDLDFPALSRDYAARGTGLLLVPAWDRVADGWAHGRMAIMRGVEYGMSVARAAKQGTLTLSDERGRLIAEAHSDSTAMVTLIADVPVSRAGTIYARIGDIFGWGCVGLLALLVVVRVRRS